MFDIYKKQPFIPIMLVTEGSENSGDIKMNKTAGETYATAKAMINMPRTNEQCSQQRDDS